MNDTYFELLVDFARGHCGAEETGIRQLDSETYRHYERALQAKANQTHGPDYNYDLDIEIGRSRIKFGLDYALHTLLQQCDKRKLTKAERTKLIELRRRVNQVKTHAELQKVSSDIWSVFRQAAIVSA